MSSPPLEDAVVAGETLKDLLHAKGLKRAEQLLLCLGAEPSGPKAVREIKALARGAGLRRVKDWNVSDILSRMDGLVVRMNDGWDLTAAGRSALADLLSRHNIAPTAAPANSLRTLLPRITSRAARDFLDEAVACLEYGQLRAAVVLSWVGAMALLHDHVLTSQLAAFNTEAKRRDPKWKDAKSADGLAKMKEFDFLQVSEAISIFDRNTKLELEICLKLRNACGHPSSLSIAEHRVASHLEILLLNVYTPFGV